jgi:hypothetical protein
MGKSLNFNERPTRRARTEPEEAAESEQAREFVSGADIGRVNGSTTKAKRRGAQPENKWPTKLDDILALPDDRRINLMNVRLTDRERAALQYLHAHMPDSMHQVCIDAVRREINVRIKKLTGRLL